MLLAETVPGPGTGPEESDFLISVTLNTSLIAEERGYTVRMLLSALGEAADGDAAHIQMTVKITAPGPARDRILERARQAGAQQATSSELDASRYSCCALRTRSRGAVAAVLILDESVAALDVSIQAQMLNLLADIRDQTGISYLLITHDLAVVRQFTDETLVPRRGTVVERGSTARVLDHPEHPYTQQLRASVPRPGWKPGRRARPGAGTT